MEFKFRLMQGFLFNGIWITDPFMDETGRFSVDPKEYYGVDVNEGEDDE